MKVPDLYSVFGRPGLLYTQNMKKARKISRLFLSAHHLLQLVHKCVDILKLPVYRGKTHIGNRIQIFEPVHHQLSDHPAGNLLFPPVEDLRLHIVHQLRDLICAHRALMTGAKHSRLNLGTVIGLSVIVLFDHDQGNGLHLLVGGETPAALVADTAAADGIVFIRRSGIDHARVVMTAEWTFHVSSFFLPLTGGISSFSPL